MKPLAVVLAASLLGIGCIVSDDCNTRTVSIGWPTFLLADGTQTASCGAAGVSSVDVFMDGQSVGNFACTEGGVSVTSVPDGTHVFTVEGLDASSFIILRDEITLGATCGEQVVSVRPAEGTLRFAYGFEGDGPCFAGGSFIWFNLTDETANAVTVAVDQNSANPETYVCGDVISFVVPAGTYAVAMEEVVRGATPGQYDLTAVACIPTRFTVAPAALSVVEITMTDPTLTTVACF
jgi:hypothetical protein